jgi:hypothetical protein
MDNTLNINHLILLFKRYFIENKQRELTFWGISTVVFMLMHQSYSVEMYMYISGFIFASQMFKSFNYTPGGMHYLLVPATHIEKLIINILLSTFYFFIMILITYLIGTTIGTVLGNLIFGTNSPISFDIFYADSISKTYNDIAIHHIGFIDIFFSFALVQSVFLLGSIYFKGNAVGKTILSIIALAIVIGIIESVLLKLTLGSFSLSKNSFNLTIYDGESLFSGFDITSKIIKYMLIPFFWIVAYFRLTEKEI